MRTRGHGTPKTDLNPLQAKAMTADIGAGGTGPDCAGGGTVWNRSRGTASGPVLDPEAGLGRLDRVTSGPDSAPQRRVRVAAVDHRATIRRVGPSPPAPPSPGGV